MVHFIVLILFAPKTGAMRIVPKIGAMRNPRLSIHSTEHMKLRQLLIRRRLDLGLSQRALAEKLDVVHSFIGKVETGDRRLDVFEFVEYCHALDLNAADILQQLQAELDAE